jgi:hypothetical protein
MFKSAVSPYKLSFAGVAALACALGAIPAWAGSQARIVRLSDVQGSVEIDKNSGMGFERAFLNLPITQGAQLRTRDNARAEIEFEDGSTLRVGPNASVQFDTLNLNDAGQRVSVVDLVEGMAYVNWTAKNSDDFTLNFSHEKVSLDHPAHFRVAVSPELAKLAVFKGDVDVEGPAGKETVGKKKTATFDAANEDKYTLAKDFDQAPLDSWDKQASEYHDQYAHNNSTPYGYGFSDLNYYGAYQNVAGYGMLWQPYFTGVGWDPFMDGAWSWYPGMGSMFVSAYPWGWLPYRYGNWMFIPSFGWMWQPGNWNSVATVPRFSGTLPARFRAPVAPAGTVRTVAVGRGGPVSSTIASSTVVRGGTAGLGISRGSLGNLNHLNSQVAKSGAVVIHSQPQFSARNGSSSGGYTPSHSAGVGGSSVGRSSAGSIGGGGGGHSSGGTGGHH